MRLENLALCQVWVVGGLGATCQCAKCVSAKKNPVRWTFYFFCVCLSVGVVLPLPLTLRICLVADCGRFNCQTVERFERAKSLAKRSKTAISDLLNKSPKYLSEICKKNSGRTASEWIQNYTTQRLIILLENHDLNFTEIADILNFSSQSCFSRYVRKVLGVSPSEYRLRLQKNQAD